MKMCIGVQTIPWGRRFGAGLPAMLREIKQAGYEGIELWQHPNDIGPAEDLFALLEHLHLKLLGVAGGSMREKVDFVRGMIRAEQQANLKAKSARDWIAYSPGRRLPYVYVDGWEGQRSAAAARNEDGYTLALHPAMFKTIQTMREAEPLLVAHPKLRFLPDTGHLTVAGEDVIGILDKWFRRIEAVHLKDWHAEYGRSLQFYSRGFTELGTGDVELRKIVGFLKERRSDAWLVVDLNSTDDPQRSARVSRAWLREHASL